MLIDVHMHAGDFTDPFDAALDADGLAGIFTAHQLDAGMVFCRRNALTWRSSRRSRRHTGSTGPTRPTPGTWAKLANGSPARRSRA